MCQALRPERPYPPLDILSFFKFTLSLLRSTQFFLLCAWNCILTAAWRPSSNSCWLLDWHSSPPGCHNITYGMFAMTTARAACRHQNCPGIRLGYKANVDDLFKSSHLLHGRDGKRIQEIFTSCPCFHSPQNWQYYLDILVPNPMPTWFSFYKTF